MSHYYKILKSNGQLIKEFNQAPCFAAYNYDKKFGKRKVEVIIKPMNFTINQAREHIQRLNDCGFKCSLINEDKKHPSVLLSEDDYKCKAHIRLALDFIRPLFESGLNRVLQKYFKINKRVRNKYDYIQLIQLIHLIKKSGGHGIPGSYYLHKGGVHSSTEINELLDNPSKFKITRDELYNNNTGSSYIMSALRKNKKVNCRELKVDRNKFRFSNEDDLKELLGKL